MRKVKIGAIVEAGLWLSLAIVLYAFSFEFDREIEIYKFGASAWPRAILLLIAIAAIGQLAHHWYAAHIGVGVSVGADADEADSPDAPARGALAWHLSTFALIALPFAYIVLPGVLQGWLDLDKAALHTLKLVCAGALIAIYALGMRRNLVGAILALPIFFGALMQDLGFYALAPVFAVGVMYLMGERRVGWIALIAAIIVALLLLLFVSVLYVGLPTGNISPFYEIGTGLVKLLQ